MIWRILRFTEHLFYLRHRKGHGIHSPYLFEFVHQVLFNVSRDKVPEWVTRAHRRLKNDRTMIPVTTIGAVSRVETSQERSVRSFVSGSSVSRKYGSLLFRIAAWIKPEMILELGTGVGVSTLYLASGCPDCRLLTIEGNAHRAEYARSMLERSGVENTEVHVADLDLELERILSEVETGGMEGGRLLAFVDGNHRYEPTLRYVRKLMKISSGESAIIVDDIFWSKEMYRAWKELVAMPEVRISIDLFHMGILLLRSDLHKVHLKIMF